MSDMKYWEALAKPFGLQVVGYTYDKDVLLEHPSGFRSGASAQDLAAMVTTHRNQIIQELRALALGSEADEYKSYDGHVAEWLAAMLDEPNAEPNRLTDPAAKIKDEARWVAFEDVCRAANKAGEALPSSVRKLIGGEWADKHVRGGE
jgi:hypothetical protein